MCRGSFLSRAKQQLYLATIVWNIDYVATKDAMMQGMKEYLAKVVAESFQAADACKKQASYRFVKIVLTDTVYHMLADMLISYSLVRLSKPYIHVN